MTQTKQFYSPTMHIIGEGAALGEDIGATLRAAFQRRDRSSEYTELSPLHILGEGTELGDAVTSSLRNAARRVARYRMYRRSVRELSQMNAHELADLGLHRSEIRRVAHETIYGQRS